MKKKTATLADLESRVGNWVSAYIADHGLIPLGRCFKLNVEVEHHKTTHLFTAKSKVGKAWPVATDEPVTDKDWDTILNLSIWEKPAEDSTYFQMRQALEQMKNTDQGVPMQRHHAIQVNTIFDGNGLQYHVFCVFRPRYGTKGDKYKLYKKY